MNMEAASTAIELLVEGMHCGGCASRVQKILITNGSVASIEVDLDKKRVVISGDLSLQVDAIIASLGEQGFTAKLIDYTQGSRLSS